MKDPIELDPDEQRIEDEADQYRPVTGAERERLTRKLQGIPYQTRIKAVLHQHATNQVWLLADQAPGYLDDRITRVARRVFEELSER